ncbi:MAG TPA: EAL domain-containing protein [Mycobacteriales bacterium]|nr:EAL domain-containing protein [Mycobacteriales bacterium]
MGRPRLERRRLVRSRVVRQQLELAATTPTSYVIGAPPGPRHAGRRLVLLYLGMTATLAALVAGLGTRPPLTGALHLPWWSLALLFLVTSGVQLHVEVRRSAHSVTLTDLAVVVALFSGSPALAPILRAATWIPISAWRYRRSARRAWFNVLLGPLETALAAGVFTVAAASATVRDPHAWVAAVLGVLIAGLVGALLVTGAIALNDGHFEPAPLRQAVTLGAVVGGGTSTLGLVGVLLVDATDAGRWLLVALATVLVLAYRSYAVLRDRHHGLESLFAFTRSLSHRTDDEALPTLLRLASERLGGEMAQLLVQDWPGTDGPVLLSMGAHGRVESQAARLEDHWPFARVLTERTAMILSERSNDEAVRSYLRRVGRREMILAPLGGDADSPGVLAVCDRTARAVRQFNDDDLRLLETMATHGAAELTNARLVNRLRHDATHDALTGLRNRSVLAEAVDVLPVVLAGQVTGAVVVLDLDDFKQVNDALGHHVGDLLLQRIADRLQQLAAGGGAAVCRLGGDEFGVVLAGGDKDLLLARVKALAEQLARPVDLGPVTVSTAASIGMALVGPQGYDDAVLLQRADVAMYAAKRTGRGVVVFDESIDNAQPERLSLASDLRRLFAGEGGYGRLEVHYQPQLDCRTGEPLAVEALVRWAHPTLGLVPPDEFVPIAESTGLAGPLTHVVLGRALADVRSWDGAGHHLAVAVNLSARCLHDVSLVDDITAALVTHGVSASRLTLELTESCIVSDPVKASEVFTALAACGVRLSVDDFGTGYSSLSHLARLPMSEVKVDKAFVQRMRHDAKDRAIVRSVVRLADELGMAVVAEGVEDAETAAELADLGCDSLQGYYYSRPVPAAALLAWLDERRQQEGSRLRRIG